MTSRSRQKPGTNFRREVLAAFPNPFLRGRLAIALSLDARAEHFAVAPVEYPPMKLQRRALENGASRPRSTTTNSRYSSRRGSWNWDRRAVFSWLDHALPLVNSLYTHSLHGYWRRPSST